MKRRGWKQRSAVTIPEPTGPEWLKIGAVRLWLPKAARASINYASAPSDQYTLTTGVGWAVARSALDFMLRCTLGAKTKYEIGWIDKIGRGLSKEVYSAEVSLYYGKEESSDLFAISQLAHHADEDAGTRMIREQLLLDAIGKYTPYISVPKPLGMAWQGGRLVTIASYVAGMNLDLRSAQSSLERPWEIVGKIAAEIHCMPSVDLPACLERHPTWREHVVYSLNKFQQYDVPEIREAVQWISANLPPARESVLVHGDLLGQNILWTLEQELFVIDWEYAFLGDPAYDLAIVTRGVKKPFQASGGLERLLDAYLSSGGQEISKSNIRAHEFLLGLGWYEQSLDRSLGGQSPEYHLEFLRSLLKRSDKLLIGQQ